MRVNIQYSCDLEQVPKEMARLIEDALNELNADVVKVLEEVQGTLNFSSDFDELISAVQKIESVRHILNGMDHTLSDCDNVLKGYVNTRAQLQQQAEAEAAAPQEELTVDEIVTQIEDAEEEVTDEGH
jgi:hypothetical protein